MRNAEELLAAGADGAACEVVEIAKGPRGDLLISSQLRLKVSWRCVDFTASQPPG